MLRNDLCVVGIHHPRFIELISASIKFGKKVLIENAGEEINRALYPLFDT